MCHVTCACECSEAFFVMIAFITCNSNLVPVLEVLCSSNPCRLEVSGFWIFFYVCVVVLMTQIVCGNGLVANF